MIGIRFCCPAGHGCNAPDGDEPCALDLCRAAAGREHDAAIALERWSIFQRACEQRRGESEQRFRRRAFERARDQALIALALRPEPTRPPRQGLYPRRRSLLSDTRSKAARA